MGLLDDAIRQHLELKRRHGADASDVAKLEREAFGPAEQPEPAAMSGPAEEAEAFDAYAPGAPFADPEAPEPALVEESDSYFEPAPPAGPLRPGESVSLDEVGERTTELPAFEPDPQPDSEPGEHDELEETPEFLQETPEHDRLWFEQKPPRDFDF